MTTTPLEKAADTGPSLQDQRSRAAFWFLAPMLAALFCVAAWPLLRTIYFSLTNTSLDDLYGGHFVGFYNYLHVLKLSSGKVLYRGTLVDPAWWNAVWNTVRFSVISVSFETVFGTCVALMLNANFVGRGFVRAAILIPWAIPTIVSAKMWAWMLNDQYGIINDVFVKLHLLCPPDRLDGEPRHGDEGGADGRHLEDDALHGASDPRRPADGAA